MTTVLTSCLLEETTNRTPFVRHEKDPVTDDGTIQDYEKNLPEGAHIVNYYICEEGKNLTANPKGNAFCESKISTDTKVYVTVGLGGDTKKEFQNLYNFCTKVVDNKSRNCNGLVRIPNTEDSITLEDTQIQIANTGNKDTLVFTYDKENFPKSFYFSIKEITSGALTAESLMTIRVSDGVITDLLKVFQYNCVERFVYAQQDATTKAFSYFYSQPQVDYFIYSELYNPYVSAGNDRLIICQDKANATFTIPVDATKTKLALNIPDSSTSPRINKLTFSLSLFNSNDKDFEMNGTTYDIEETMVEIYDSLSPTSWRSVDANKPAPQIFKMLTTAIKPLSKMTNGGTSDKPIFNYYYNAPIGMYIRAQKIKNSADTYGCPSANDFTNTTSPTTYMNKALAKVLGGEINSTTGKVTKVKLEPVPFYVACSPGGVNVDTTGKLEGNFPIPQPARITFITEPDLLTIVAKNNPDITPSALRQLLTANAEFEFPMPEGQPSNAFTTDLTYFVPNGQRLFRIVHPALLSLAGGLNIDCENEEGLAQITSALNKEHPNKMVGCMVRDISK